MKFEKYLNEAKKKPQRLTMGPKKKINKQLTNLTSPKFKTRYFDSIPLEEIEKILEKFGIVILQEDMTEWNGILTGRDGQAYFDVGSKKSGYRGDFGYIQYIPYIDTQLALSWHKMESGRYEIVTYLT